MKLPILLLTLSTAVAQMPPAPSVVPLPPQTNRYYLHCSWDTNCNNTAEFSWGTNGFQNTNIFSGGECRVSNLVYGPIYGFRTATNCTMNWTTVFPLAQLPLTNFLDVIATGALFVCLTSLSGPLTFTTNRHFALSQNKNAAFATTNHIPPTFTRSNNQVNISQLMHRQ